LSSWIRIRIRNLNADPDPDPATQINADPCGSGSGYGSGSETLVTSVQQQYICARYFTAPVPYIDVALLVAPTCNGMQIRITNN
jgi:hypothetical protein